MGEREDAERWRFIREHLFVWPEEMADGKTRPCMQMKFGHGIIPSGVVPFDNASFPDEVDRALDAWRAASSLEQKRDTNE